MARLLAEVQADRMAAPTRDWWAGFVASFRGEERLIELFLEDMAKHHMTLNDFLAWYVRAYVPSEGLSPLETKRRGDAAMGAS